MPILISAFKHLKYFKEKPQKDFFIELIPHQMIFKHTARCSNPTSSYWNTSQKFLTLQKGRHCTTYFAKSRNSAELLQITFTVE